MIKLGNKDKKIYRIIFFGRADGIFEYI